MNIQKLSRQLICISVLLQTFCLQAAITFSSSDSKINLAASGVKLNVNAGLTISGGTLQKAAGATLIGANVAFTNGTLKQGNMSIPMYGSTTYGQSNIFALDGSDTFDVQQTTSVQGITVSGQDNLIQGWPLFFGTNAITLANTSSVTLAVQSPVNNNVVLGGAKIYLGSDLALADRANFTGQGSLTFNGYRLGLGGRDFAWTSSLRLVKAQDLQLNSNVRLSGVMIFDGDATVNGNGNELDLTLGGTIRIKANSRVNFTNTKFKGLNKHGKNAGSGLSGGNIVFDAASSSMHINQSELELNNNYTFTTGSIYVDGASNVMAKNYFLTFDQVATLTVDGTALTYEPLAYQDQNNIVGNHSYSLKSINGGSIRTLRTNPTTYEFNVDTTLGIHIVLSATKQMIISGNMTLDGNKAFIFFGSATTPVLTVKAGYTLILQNVILMNFSFKHIKLETGANIVFGNNTQIELAVNETLPTDYVSNIRFQGNGIVLHGKGESLDLSNTASLTIGGGSSVLFDDIKIKNLRGTCLRGMSTSSTVSLKDTILKVSSTYTFTRGHLEVIGDSTIMGDGQIFSLETAGTCSIASRTMLTVDRNTTFSYSPRTATRNLIWMPDVTSVLFFNGSSLKTTTTGIQFTRGTVLVDGKVDFYNTSGVALSQAIIFGDNAAAHDANISIMPAASINLQSGLIDYRNVN